MTYKLYAIFDNSTRRFSPPMAVENADVLKRQIRVSSASNPIVSQCPEDFDVFLLGTYDDTSGLISVDLCGEFYKVKDILSDSGDSNEV